MNEKERWKLIDDHAEMLYCMRHCLTRDEAYKEAIKKFCDYNEISKIARLFDITF